MRLCTSCAPAPRSPMGTDAQRRTQACAVDLCMGPCAQLLPCSSLACMRWPQLPHALPYCPQLVEHLLRQGAKKLEVMSRTEVRHISAK